MSTKIFTPPVEVTAANFDKVKNLYQNFSVADLENFAVQDAGVLAQSDFYAGQEMTLWSFASGHAAGILASPNSSLTLYATTQIILPIKTDDQLSGFAYLQGPGKIFARGNIGNLSLSGAFLAADKIPHIMHYLEHAANKPHNCGGAPHP